MVPLRKYLESSLQSATEDVRSGKYGLGETSRWRDVPKTTIAGRVKGARSRAERSEELQKLRGYQEQWVIKWALQQGRAGLPPSNKAVLKLANGLVQRDGTVGGLSEHWFKRFKARAKEQLQSIKTIRMDLKRQNVSIDEINLFFGQLKSDDFKALPDCLVWNMDETGVSEDEVTSGWVLGDASDNSRVFQPSNGVRRWNTIVECVSAAGEACPPMIIFKSESVINLEWFPKHPDVDPVLRDWYVTHQSSAWITNDLALEWLIQVFDPFTKAKAEELGMRRLLIMDGHGSHLSEDFRLACYERNIDTLILPPHTSHVLQPLDVTVFGTFKAEYRRLNRDDPRPWQLNSQESRRRFLQNYVLARVKTFTEEGIKRAFQFAGIRPINQDVVMRNSLIRKAVERHEQRRETAARLEQEEEEMRQRVNRLSSSTADNDVVPDEGSGEGLTETLEVETEQDPVRHARLVRTPVQRETEGDLSDISDTAVDDESPTSADSVGNSSMSSTTSSSSSSCVFPPPLSEETRAWWNSIMDLNGPNRVHVLNIEKGILEMDMARITVEKKLLTTNYYRKEPPRNTQTAATGAYRGLYGVRDIYQQIEERVQREAEKERQAEQKRQEKAARAVERQRKEAEKQQRKADRQKAKEQKEKEKQQKQKEKQKQQKEKQKQQKKKGNSPKKRGRPVKKRAVVEGDGALETSVVVVDPESPEVSERARRHLARTQRVVDPSEHSEDEVVAVTLEDPF